MKSATGLEGASIQSTNSCIGAGYMQYVVSEGDVCTSAIKQGSCANKSEHIRVTFAFYNEVFKIWITSLCYQHSQPSSKRPWGLQFRSSVVNTNEFLHCCKCTCAEEILIFKLNVQFSCILQKTPLWVL